MIAEATVTFDSVEYQIPYYKYLGTDNVEKLSVPFKDFYIKKNGTNTVDLSRESAAKLYEASQSLTLISYRKSQYVEGIDTDSRQALESYKTEVLERDDDGTWAKRIGLIGTFGGLAIAVGAAAVCTATVVCAIVIIGALITGGTGVGGYVSATYSNAEVFDKSARTIIIVESYQNNFEVFRETSEFSSLLGIGFELENEIAVNYSELENSIDSIELAFAKLLGAHYGLTQLPHIPEVDLVASSLWAASNVVASPLKLDVVNAGVNSLAFAVGYVLDRQAEGMEVTDEMFLSKMEDSFTTANVKAPDFFHENRLAIYSLNLLQFQASIEPKETVDRAISGAITTSQGSQLRFRFDNYPVGKTLKVQNNTQTWTYTIPDSGQVFPVINMGSDNTGIDYQVTDSDGLVIINTQTFDTVLIENTVTGVQATSLNDGVRITYNSGLPSGYDGVIICQGLSEPSSNFNGDTALPNVNDGCGTDSIVVMAAHDTSSNYLNLNQGEIYYYSVQPYNLVPATTDPDNAAYYEMATPIQVAARPNISGTLKGTPQNHQIPDGEFTSAIVWEASGFNPYRISGTLNIPANDEFTWFDDAANNTLIIEPKTSVHMLSQSSKLIVYGSMYADAPSNGTDPIIITSDNSNPAAGDWGSIQFIEGSSGTLNSLKVEYGGDGSAGVYLDGNATFSQLSMRHIKGNGVWFRKSTQGKVFNSHITNVSKYALYATSTGAEVPTNKYTAQLNYLEGTNGETSLGHNGIGAPPTVSGNQSSDYSKTINALHISNITITGDVTWSISDRVVDGTVTIAQGAKLTIFQGVDVYMKDRGSRLIVKGELKVLGHPSNQVYFTSINDTPAAGDWGYIHFAEGSTGTLNNVVIEYGGDDNYTSTGTNSLGKESAYSGFVSASLVIDSSPVLDNITIKNAADVTTSASYRNPVAGGIWLRGAAAPAITNSTIENAESYGFYAPSTTGDFSLTNSQLQNNAYAAYVSGTGNFVFSNNQVEDNGDNDALRVQGSIAHDTIFDQDIKLIGQVVINAGVKLTIKPGVTIYGADRASRLIVKGDLQAVGRAGELITFTSDNATPAAGDWGYIHFAPGSTGSLQYVTVEYGGDDNCTSSGSNSFGVSCRAGLASTSLMIESSPTLNHVLVKGSADITHNYSYNSQAVGLWIRGEGAPSIQNSVIDGAEYYGIYSSATKSVSLNALTIIDTKTNLGAYATNGFLNLTQTDWGTNTGPYHLTENPEGLGATVSGNVIFKWWKGEDTDGDGLPDYWENLYGSNPSVATNTSSDNDGDGLTLLQEFQLGTDFNSVDTDDDGLSDAWESEHGMQATVASDASQDFDGDGLTNLEEFTLGTDINLADTDNDGFADNLDELPLIAGEHLDFDKDGVGDFADNDDDDDGIPDDFEFSHGLNSKDASDALLDMDGDGSSNLDEFLASTDLNNASSNATVHQHIIPLQANIMVRAGNEFYSYLNYTTTDANTALPGLAFRLHFNSAAIEYIETSAIFATDFIVDSGVQIDTDNADNDPNTDSFLSFTWQDNSVAWPGVENIRLLKLKFKLLDSVAANSQHVINLSAINTQISADNTAYGFNSTPILITEGYALDLDINGDGIIDGLTDGAIFTRFMMGYAVESIATEAEMNNSTRTKQEMYQLLQAINNKQTVL
ncbi:right-handed parallel beta-helix repeat-containing protein [Paraglaciecola sp. MB-3u-78]|uniref:right-handed parallel beta-helix repeat-containing protein n=1 Tax=Paraglaciecola sp. MB-3u-78 TaxID=2058332 RepID=UPI000C33DB51|nr:right-handed parallel beta-helix repeat-containing protein [Paraglaciecola sp. MB-3u-78]PKG96786.1 hypothetical protein CXF95_23550 [Paraglaciecola sp. MB-3u-78]